MRGASASTEATCLTPPEASVALNCRLSNRWFRHLTPSCLPRCRNWYRPAAHAPRWQGQRRDLLGVTFVEFFAEGVQVCEPAHERVPLRPRPALLDSYEDEGGNQESPR